MNIKLQETLEELAEHSAWTLSEVSLLLTGKTLLEVKGFQSKSPPPSSDLKWVLMKKTKIIEIRPGYSAHFKKGQTTPIDKDLLESFIKNGSGKEVECPSEIEKERREYQEAQDQFKLLERLERGVLDHDIKTLNGTNQSPAPECRLDKHSVLKWVNIDQTILKLRHFPEDISDILLNKLLLSEATHLTADKVVEGSTGENQQTNKTRVSRRGRPRFPYSESFKDEVQKLYARNIPKTKIPYRASITKLLNPEAINVGRTIYKDEYKEIYKYAYSTVYRYVVKAISE
jgi:hypothetical protein|tara:strand:+ start:909 stop:1769 length:861 start_codon:yes stop_codon:yes gene_type:complete